MDIKLYVNLWHEFWQLRQIEQMMVGGLEPYTSRLRTTCLYDVILK